MSGTGFRPSLPEPVRDAFAILKASAESGRLAHAYVVSCDRMEWGLNFATLMLQWLFCPEAIRPCGVCRACRQIEARAHADVIWIEPESKSRVIKIEQIREQVNPLIQQMSFEGGWKSAVLLEADRITDGAANAFLKTLEEPPPKSLMLLVTMNFPSLMSTIISRCQRIHVGDRDNDIPASRVEAAMLDWLRRRSPASPSLMQAAWISTILSEVRETAEKQEKASAGDEVDDDVLKARIQSRAIEARLQILRLIFRWERDLLLLVGGGDKKFLHFPGDLVTLTRQSAGLSVTQCLQRLEQVEKAVQMLERNVPEGSVWEAILPV
jgi:DNA polymerase-3 subunit delta'